jgi:transposase-like protein
VKEAVMTGERRNHEATIKARVALAALKGDKTLAQLATRLQVHHSQMLAWKQQLLKHCEELFSREGRTEPEADGKALHARIGQLTMENDFLSGALGRGSAPSAKR